jgi:hypothetical protein
MLDSAAFRQYSQQKFFEIWQKASEEEKLEGEEASIAAAMLEHGEYYDTWEKADTLANYEYDPETDVNPFLHVTIHSIVENQIAMNTPREVRTTLEKLEAKGESHHEAVHKIGTALIEEIFRTMKHNKPFDQKRYIQNLKRLR